MLAVLRGGERPSQAFWLASGAGLLGILVFASTRGAQGLGEADLLALGAVALGALGYCEGGLLAREMPAAHVICWALLLSAPFLALPTAWVVARVGLSAGPAAWAGFAYVAVLSMFLGFFAFYRGMSEAGIARVSQIQLAQPVCSLIWSALFLGEHIDASTVIAAVFVVGLRAGHLADASPRRLRRPGGPVMIAQVLALALVATPGEAVWSELQTRWRPRLEPLLSEVMAFPTVWTDREALAAQRRWLARVGPELGFVVRDRETMTEVDLPGPDGAPVLGLVVHGDLQPVNASEWTVPPFAATFKDGAVWGRGVRG